MKNAKDQVLIVYPKARALPCALEYSHDGLSRVIGWDVTTPGGDGDRGYWLGCGHLEAVAWEDAAARLEIQEMRPGELVSIRK